MSAWRHPALFHGGIPDLRVGDVIEPGHGRKAHDGCPWCAAREKGEAYMGMDGPAQHGDRVYATTNRLYAKHFASLWGRGDLYRVEAVGELERSTEDTIETYMAPAFRVAAILDRVVLLTNQERRRLVREWTAADLAAGAAVLTGRRA